MSFNSCVLTRSVKMFITKLKVYVLYIKNTFMR